MTEESFSKQTYTLEDLANDTFWRDLGSKDTDSIYWNYGLWAEQERLRKALDEGVVVNSEWCNEDFRIPRTLHHGMYEYLKGANEFRCRVAIALYYGDKFTQDGACSSFYLGDTKYQQRPAPDYVIQYFEKRKKTMAEKKILSIVLEKKWFKKIISGEKTEEYREIKPYWASRLVTQKAESGEVLFDEFGGYCRVRGEPEYKPFTHVLFYAGYAKDRQVVEKKIESISIGKPQKGMCPEEWLNKDVFIIRFR